MDKKERIYLVSDAHLGVESANLEELKSKRLLAFLDHVGDTGSRLIILGDLFDFWFEYRSMIDAAQFPVLACLWQLRRNGVQIDYHLGNHDYWTFGFLGRDIVSKVHSNPSSEVLGGKKAFIAHGDGLTDDEKGYLIMKRLLRHPVTCFLFRFLHPDAGAWLARKTSKTSRTRIDQKREKSASILREFAREKLETGEYDWIIAGHSHQPERSEFGNGVYLNIGDWSEHFTYGLVNGGEIQLRKWKE